MRSAFTCIHFHTYSFIRTQIPSYTFIYINFHSYTFIFIRTHSFSIICIHSITFVRSFIRPFISTAHSHKHVVEVVPLRGKCDLAARDLADLARDTLSKTVPNFTENSDSRGGHGIFSTVKFYPKTFRPRWTSSIPCSPS